MKLHIDGQGLVGRGYRVALDGVDISNSLREVTLRLAPGEVNKAEIVLALDEITVSAEALASLTAIGREAKLAEEECFPIVTADYETPASRALYVDYEVEVEPMPLRPDPGRASKGTFVRWWRRP